MHVADRTERVDDPQRGRDERKQNIPSGGLKASFEDPAQLAGGALGVCRPENPIIGLGTRLSLTVRVGTELCLTGRQTVSQIRQLPSSTMLVNHDASVSICTVRTEHGDQESPLFSRDSNCFTSVGGHFHGYVAGQLMLTQARRRRWQ